MASGAIELPGSGAPIILGVDHPTTGGYPVIACVIEADLPAVGQLAPGDTVGFECVSREAARAAYLERLAAFNTELPPHG
jgi:allophanate hydrolase subunit 2